MSALWSCIQCPLLHEYPDQTVFEVPSSRTSLGVTLLILSQIRELMGFYLSGTCVSQLRAHFPCTSVQCFQRCNYQACPRLSPCYQTPAFLAHKTVSMFPKRLFSYFPEVFVNSDLPYQKAWAFPKDDSAKQPTSSPKTDDYSARGAHSPPLIKNRAKSKSFRLEYIISECPKAGTKMISSSQKKVFTTVDYFQNFLTRKKFCNPERVHRWHYVYLFKAPKFIPGEWRSLLSGWN